MPYWMSALIITIPLIRRSAAYGSRPKVWVMKDFQWVTRSFQKSQVKNKISKIFFSRGHQHKAKIKNNTQNKRITVCFRYFFFIKVHLLCIEITIQTSASWIYLTLSNNTTFSSNNILRGGIGPLGSWLGAWDFHWVMVKKGCRPQL